MEKCVLSHSQRNVNYSNKSYQVVYEKSAKVSDHEYHEFHWKTQEYNKYSKNQFWIIINLLFIMVLK